MLLRHDRDFTQLFLFPRILITSKTQNYIWLLQRCYTHLLLNLEMLVRQYDSKGRRFWPTLFRDAWNSPRARVSLQPAHDHLRKKCWYLAGVQAIKIIYYILSSPAFLYITRGVLRCLLGLLAFWGQKPCGGNYRKSVHFMKWGTSILTWWSRTWRYWRWCKYRYWVIIIIIWIDGYAVDTCRYNRSLASVRCIRMINNKLEFLYQKKVSTTFFGKKT